MATCRFSYVMGFVAFFGFFTANCLADEKKSFKKEKLAFDLGTVRGAGQIKFKPESFFLKNINLLNNNNSADQFFFSRSTIDASIDLLYGKQCYGHDVAEFFVTFRNRSVWGNPESIAQTTETNLKILEAVFGAHRHFVAKHMVWIRELWLNFCINNAFGLDFRHKYFFTLGSFPFELGRGISLGSAYAVGPRVLGFFSDNVVDQYAFGFKLSGDIYADCLSQDLYLAVLQNKGDNLGNTGAKIRGQEFGRKLRPMRGPGKIEHVVAGRLKWFPVKGESTLASFEPYALYLHAPEHHVELPSDSSAKLGTLGLAGEFVCGNFEWGFDGAVNVGGQKVKGIDRNVVEFKNNLGTVQLVNSRVHDTSATGSKTLYVPGGAAQKIIEGAAEDVSQNGKFIGTAGGVDLYNDINRFRNPYFNRFKGWMFTADAAYSFGQKKKVKLAATAGIASGDQNPNKDIENPNDSNVDGDFRGFIGLQEIYSGRADRVQSVFLLGGTGKIPRPLWIPLSKDVVDRVPSLISGFTNLVFVGSAVHWYPTCGDRNIAIRGNILSYWQEKATNAFDLAARHSSTNLARNYLGTELNAFTDADIFDGCKIFFIGSVFFPGTHYADIKGTPISNDDLKILDNPDASGITTDNNSLLGDDTAYTINFGLEFRF